LSVSQRSGQSALHFILFLGVVSILLFTSVTSVPTIVISVVDFSESLDQA